MLHKRYNEKIAVYLAKMREYSDKFKKNYKKEKGINAIVIFHYFFFLLLIEIKLI